MFLFELLRDFFCCSCLHCHFMLCFSFICLRCACVCVCVLFCAVHSFCFHTIYVENRANKCTHTYCYETKIVNWFGSSFFEYTHSITHYTHLDTERSFCSRSLSSGSCTFLKDCYCIFVGFELKELTEWLREECNRQESVYVCVELCVFSSHHHFYFVISVLMFHFQSAKENYTHVSYRVCAMCDALQILFFILLWPRSCQRNRQNQTIFDRNEENEMKWTATRYGIHKTFHIVRILSLFSIFPLFFWTEFILLLLLLMLLLSHLFLCVAQCGKQPVIYHTLLEILPFSKKGKMRNRLSLKEIPRTLSKLLSLFPIPVRTRILFDAHIELIL